MKKLSVGGNGFKLTPVDLTPLDMHGFASCFTTTESTMSHEEQCKLYNYTVSNKPNNKPMSKIAKFVKDATLSSNERLLRKVGLKNEEGNWTGDARIIVLDKEAKERGYKNWDKMTDKFISRDYVSPFEFDDMFKKYGDDLIEIAKKYKKESKK